MNHWHTSSEVLFWPQQFLVTLLTINSRIKRRVTEQLRLAHTETALICTLTFYIANYESKWARQLGCHNKT